MEVLGRRMRGFVGLAVAMAVVVAMTEAVGKEEEDGMHHIVGGDRGWDVSSNMDEWSAGRHFTVGDNIWFAYHASNVGVAELGSKEEFESCDLTNPIKMYTEGLTRLKLHSEGSRYFVASKFGSCSSGLKLHVQVLPKSNSDFAREAVVLAEEPSAPSGTAGDSSVPVLSVTLVAALCFLGFN